MNSSNTDNEAEQAQEEKPVKRKRRSIFDTTTGMEPSEETEPKKRGRKKAAQASEADTPEAVSAEGSSANLPAIRKTSSRDFYFTCGVGTDKQPYLCFQFAKGKTNAARGTPDFRRYTGLERDVLRDFFSLLKGRERSFTINFDGEEQQDDVIFQPNDALIEKLLSAKLICNEDLQVLALMSGSYRATLRLVDMTKKKKEAKHGGISSGNSTAALPSGNAWINASLLLKDEEGTLTEVKADSFFMLSPRFAVMDDKVYRIEDIGLRWMETDKIQSGMKGEDLPSYLSFIFSSFSNLDFIYEGWTLRKIRPCRALPALLFMEIDSYNYLHVRPISYIRGLPSLFLENEDIVSVAELDEADSVIGIAEIIFPENPGELFMSMLTKKMTKGMAKNQMHEEQGRFIIAPEFAKTFFADNIMELARNFVLLESQVLNGYKLSFSQPRIRFNMGLGSGIDYFSGTAEVEIEGERFSFKRFIDEYRKNSCITLSDGTKSIPDKRSMDRLDRLVSRIRGDNNVELSYFDVPLLLQDEAIEIEGKAWEDAKAFFTEYNSIAQRKGNWTLDDTVIRPYQEFGVRWLDYLREHGMGACLADEMGLGKTIQVIALLKNLMEAGVTGNCLVLCPKSLVFNWANELKHRAPSIPVKVYYGANRDAATISTGDFQVLLSTYATIRIDIEDFVKMEFLYIILDESQNVKNLAAKTTGAVLSLKSQYRIALSGTPVENNLSELFSLFRFLNPAFFGSEQLFISRYLKPIQENNDEESMKDLKARIYPFMLRRLKRDVLQDLPPQTEETAYIELDDEHLKVYHRRRLEYQALFQSLIGSGAMNKSAIIVLKALTELRRLASVPESEGEYIGPSAKRLYLRDMISELVENDHKCLIFTNFLAQVDFVSQDLTDIGIGCLTMTGATSDRQNLVRRFQNDDAIKAFIMTLKTGGTGLNLTAADYIFILDPWWNSAAEAQAIGRAHRIGQENPVFCYRLIARDTIEERILELQKRKTDLAGALLNDDSSAFKTLSADDVAFLVGDDFGGGV
ncbi:DEAD/DEAH box helicase [Breznakiellaceae bacterium SP9]